jgi:hypothetical protein
MIPLIDFPLDEMCPGCARPAERRFRRGDDVVAYICQAGHVWCPDGVSREEADQVLADFDFTIRDPA